MFAASNVKIISETWLCPAVPNLTRAFAVLNVDPSKVKAFTVPADVTATVEALTAATLLTFTSVNALVPSRISEASPSA